MQGLGNCQNRKNKQTQKYNNGNKLQKNTMHFDLRFAAVYSKQQITIFMFRFFKLIEWNAVIKMILNYGPWHDIFHLFAHDKMTCLISAENLLLKKIINCNILSFHFLISMTNVQD